MNTWETHAKTEHAFLALCSATPAPCKGCWWAEKLWLILISLCDAVPLVLCQPKQTVLLETLCAGMCGEVLALEVFFCSPNRVSKSVVGDP